MPPRGRLSRRNSRRRVSVPVPNAKRTLGSSAFSGVTARKRERSIQIRRGLSQLRAELRRCREVGLLRSCPAPSSDKVSTRSKPQNTDFVFEFLRNTFTVKWLPGLGSDISNDPDTRESVGFISVLKDNPSQLGITRRYSVSALTDSFTDSNWFGVYLACIHIDAGLGPVNGFPPQQNRSKNRGYA